MELFTTEFFAALLSIILIDLVLAGDNALLLGLVAKNLPKKQQKKVIVFGTVAAVFVRIVLTIAAVQLLQVDGILLIGGVLLIYISYKVLLTESDMKVHSEKKSFWGAVGTIIVADVIMGFDNIIAVAGAAHGNIILVSIGLIISIPIVIWGSTFVIRMIEKLPIIVFAGAGILAWTAAGMIAQDAYVSHFFLTENAIQKFEAIVVLTVLIVSSCVKLFQINKGNKKITQKQG